MKNQQPRILATKATFGGELNVAFHVSLRLYDEFEIAFHCDKGSVIQTAPKSWPEKQTDVRSPRTLRDTKYILQP